MVKPNEPVQLSAQEVRYIQKNPGKVWRNVTGDLMVTVMLPEMSERKEVTRFRLAAGVAEAFVGSKKNPLLSDYLRCAYEGELLVIETSLTGRAYGVVLHSMGATE